MILEATKAADNAATKTFSGTMLKGISPNTTSAMAVAAGTAAGEAATREGAGALADITSLSCTASHKAARSIIQESVEITGEVTGGVASNATGIASGTSIGKAISSLPLLNFGFAAWDCYETVKAGTQLYYGPDEEHVLRSKIKELKQEANNIVSVIYNYYANKENPKLPSIAVPF